MVDFNVVMNEKDKLGEPTIYPLEYENFALCLYSCELGEINSKGSPFTWWNSRTDDQCIFKKLDRMVANQVFHKSYRFIEVEYLAKIG